MTLFLVATPIGNLSDMSYRAVDTLKSVDYILCEDTRHSLTLLQHYAISKPLKSYHKFSESSQQESLLSDLQAGKKIALISDAGTPGISDPGQRLVQACRESGLEVIAIPGACAAITALSCSGLETDRFQFLGFLPKKSGELRHVLKEALMYSGSTVCYESPNRLKDVLKELVELAPERKLVVGRELTKKFEEVRSGTASELLAYWETHTLKGEIVVMISGNKISLDDSWKTLSPEEHVKMMQDTYHLTKNEAIKMVAQIRGVPKREVYRDAHSLDSE